MTNTMVILPMRLSALIRIGIADTLAVEELRDRYAVDMRLFHLPWRFRRPWESGVCAVCFAGSVMARSLGADVTAQLWPDDFPGNERQLHALDSLRCGEVSCAWADLGMLPKEDVLSYDRYITPYSEDREKFFAEMEALARDLEEGGL